MFFFLSERQTFVLTPGLRILQPAPAYHYPYVSVKSTACSLEYSHFSHISLHTLNTLV